MSSQATVGVLERAVHTAPVVLLLPEELRSVLRA